MRKIFIVIAIVAAAVLPCCLSGCGGNAPSGYIPGFNINGGGNTSDMTADVSRPLSLVYELNADETGYILTDVDEKTTGVMTVEAVYNDLPVVEIGRKAFAHCKQLTEIVLPAGVTSVGAYAFENCEKLTAVTLSDSLLGIGRWAFSGCAALTEIVIPASVTEIGEYAFRFCRKLESATFGATDGWCTYWSSTALTGAKPAAAQLADPAKAAAYLKTTYNYCLWKRDTAA